jgi:hypothetical protein
MEADGRRGTAEYPELDCEDEVERPRSLVRPTTTFSMADSSLGAARGNVLEEYMVGLGDSFRRRMLAPRGREKFSACTSGVCLPSDDCEVYPEFSARNREASEGRLCSM